jgi:hypothetical protein
MFKITAFFLNKKINLKNRDQFFLECLMEIRSENSNRLMNDGYN